MKESKFQSKVTKYKILTARAKITIQKLKTWSAVKY